MLSIRSFNFPFSFYVFSVKMAITSFLFKAIINQPNVHSVWLMHFVSYCNRFEFQLIILGFFFFFFSAWFWCIKLWTFVLRLVWQAVLLTLFCFFLAQTYGAWIRAITLSAVWGWEGFAYRRTDRLSQTVVSASSRGGQDRWVFLLCFSCVCGEAGMLLCFHSWLLLLKG